MNNFPKIQTNRLILNRLELDDMPAIYEYASNANVAKFLVNMPEPYQLKDAEFWIKNSWTKFESKEQYTFAIRLKESNAFIGGIGLILTQRDKKANMGYWLAEPFWNQGYMTEALKRVIDFGFNKLKLNKLYASHFLENASSGKVMTKAGMHIEANLKQEFFKNGQFYDVVRYAVFSK